MATTCAGNRERASRAGKPSSFSFNSRAALSSSLGEKQSTITIRFGEYPPRANQPRGHLPSYEPACARHGGNAIVAAHRPLEVAASAYAFLDHASVIRDNSPWVWALLISLQSLARTALPLSNETEIEERHEENRMDNGADAADLRRKNKVRA
jgi:hypothetical protein